mmetsp:Transcript_15872/g.31710  ORF Transcript_15872/g.31710 Transcript_15872/m.31710 type:complete len:114 (+) Transcript_15872:406-747(+)
MQRQWVQIKGNSAPCVSLPTALLESGERATLNTHMHTGRHSMHTCMQMQTPRNCKQETAISVRLVPGVRLPVFGFGMYAWTALAGLQLAMPTTNGRKGRGPKVERRHCTTREN